MNPRRPEEPRVQDRLPGEEDLSRLYQQAADEQPPLTLDATILATARRETRSRRRRFFPAVSRRWTVPFALAAALLMSIGILKALRYQMSAPRPSAAPMVLGSRSADVSLPPSAVMQERPTPLQLEPSFRPPAVADLSEKLLQEPQADTRENSVVSLQRNEGQEYVQQMLAAAQINGGLDKEEEIVAAQRRLEALELKSQLPHGDHKNARTANDKGLRYMQNRQFAEAIQAFQDAYRADPADIEIINNLGQAYLQHGDVIAAEDFLLRALVLAPDRSQAWADLGQLYARQRNVRASVACFANAYRFARNKDSVRQFLQQLAKEGTEKEQEAASQALQLQLVRGEAALGKTGDAHGEE